MAAREAVEGDQGDDALEARLLDDLMAVAALGLAFRHGVMERLEAGACDSGELGLPRDGAEILLAMLRGAGVAEPVEHGRWRLTAAMARLLARSGPAFASRVRFIGLAAADLLNAGTALLTDRPGFMSMANTFRFFRYDRALSTRASSLEDTAPWVEYVTALSEREAPVLAPLVPLADCNRLLEIGGNTGAFALALLERHPRLAASIIDLPAVCHLGRVNVAGRPGADRLRFVPGDARKVSWPEADAVLFKSVLHDWQPAEAKAMLAHAAAHVAPGGRVIVCERGPISDEPALRGAAAAANMVFAPFYRDPAFYSRALQDLGLRLLPQASVRLDMAFHVVAAECTP
jgi:hypothetical protein